MTRPACMDADEHAAWTETAEGRTPGLRVMVRVKTPCVDCTAEFAAEMRAVGRCDGKPTTRLRLSGVARVERRRAQWRAYGQRRRAVA